MVAVVVCVCGGEGGVGVQGFVEPLSVFRPNYASFPLARPVNSRLLEVPILPLEFVEPRKRKPARGKWGEDRGEQI